jgi:chromosomal replication initiation ATPase DnaA
MNKNKIASVIKKVVCEYYGVSHVEVEGKSKKKNFVKARQTAMYLIWEKGIFSLEQIGTFFNREYSTVIHARDSISRDIEIYKDELIELNRVKELVKDTLGRTTDYVEFSNDYLDQECGEMLSYVY